MKIRARYFTFLLPLFFIGILSFSFSENNIIPLPIDDFAVSSMDTIPPSKADKKQEKARKKLEQDLKKAKYKEAKEKARSYAEKSKAPKTPPVSSHNQQPAKTKKEKKTKENKVTSPGQPNVMVKTKSPKKEKKSNPNKISGKSKPVPTAQPIPGVVATKEKKKGNKPVLTQSGRKGSSPDLLSLGPAFENPKNRKRGKTCKFTYDVTDPITGQTKRALESRYFFGFTEKELMQFMKGEDFLSCTGYLSAVTGVKTLNLTFVIDSPYARDEYGSIQAGTQMIIRLINGETITLVSEKYDSGSVSRRTGKTTYKTLFIISGKDEKLLSKSEVDIVRLVWGAGYEDYEVYELDFFIDQLNCLNEAG